MSRAGLNKKIVIRKAAELANEIGFEKNHAEIACGKFERSVAVALQSHQRN